MIDIYCERHGPGLFEEPINTGSNIAFFVSALFAFFLARRRNALSPGVLVLLLLAVMVGVGSALWHMFAAPWANLMDVATILLFQLWFFWLYLRKRSGMSALVPTLSVIAYVAISALMMNVPPYFNGSIFYAPTLAALLGLSVFHYAHSRTGRWLLIIATLVFFMALVFRSMDELVCPLIPFGTHCLWHVFNGGLLYVVMKVTIESNRSCS